MDYYQEEYFEVREYLRELGDAPMSDVIRIQSFKIGYIHRNIAHGSDPCICFAA